MRTLLAAGLAIALLVSSSTVAQVPNFTGDMVPNQRQIVIQGTITPGNCVVWVNSFTIADSGSPCGSTPPPACGTGVIDLSAGCTLPIMLGLVP